MLREATQTFGARAEVDHAAQSPDCVRHSQSAASELLSGITPRQAWPRSPRPRAYPPAASRRAITPVCPRLTARDSSTESRADSTRMKGIAVAPGPTALPACPLPHEMKD